MLALARGLPRGCGLIYRAFGDTGALDQALKLRDIADIAGLVLLIGADEGLAEASGADGIHLPERDVGQVAALRQAHPDWLISAACHSFKSLPAKSDDLVLFQHALPDLCFISPVFESQSPSAQCQAPLGPKIVAEWTAQADIPLYGLGGINTGTLPGLMGAGLCGFGGIALFMG